MTPPESKKQRQKDRLEALPDKLENYPAGSEPEKATGRGSAGEARQRERVRQLLVERIIEDAIADGAFDDLPGKGKPLKLNDNPYLEPGQQLAFDLLKRNGFAPEWIERDKEIRRELARARERLRQMWQLRQSRQLPAAKWQAALAQFEAAITRLNCKIDDLNLIVPAVSLQRSRLRLAQELQRITDDSGPDKS